MIRLQRCHECAHAQYPPREICSACLSDRLASDEAAALPARVLACTVLHHSNEPRFRPRLPIVLGLVRFEAGPVALCFLAGSASPGQVVQVREGEDGLLTAGP
jgi:uncharacterized OB-fold protein